MRLYSRMKFDFAYGKHEKTEEARGKQMEDKDLKARIRASVPEVEEKSIYVRMGRKRRIVLIAAAISIFVLMIGNSIAND